MARRQRHQAWAFDREGTDLYIAARTNGAGAFGALTGLGATAARSGVGTATVQLVEENGAAMGVPAITYASAHLQLDAAPGAGAASMARIVAKSAANGTVTLRCETPGGALVEWPADNANNQINVHVRVRWTSVAT